MAAATDERGPQASHASHQAHTGRRVAKRETEGDEGAGRGSDGIGGGVRSQRGDRSCKTKVAHFDQAVGVEEHVRGLHVTMQHPRRVHVLERLEQLVHDILLVHLPTQSCNVSLACQSVAISSSGILVSASPPLVTRRQPSSHTHTARTLNANEVAGATTLALSSSSFVCSDSAQPAFLSQASADGAHALEMRQLFGQDAQHQDASRPGADLFKNIGANNSMEICVHELKHQVNVSVIVGLQYIPQLDDVFVVVELL